MNLILHHVADSESIRRIDLANGIITLPEDWMARSVKAGATEKLYNFSGGER